MSPVGLAPADINDTHPRPAQSPAGRSPATDDGGVQEEVCQVRSHAVRAADLRRSRYLGLAKTSLQNLVTAAALNLLRVATWLAEWPRAQTRHALFAALASSSA